MSDYEEISIRDRYYINLLSGGRVYDGWHGGGSKGCCGKCCGKCEASYSCNGLTPTEWHKYTGHVKHQFGHIIYKLQSWVFPKKVKDGLYKFILRKALGNLQVLFHQDFKNDFGKCPTRVMYYYIKENYSEIPEWKNTGRMDIHIRPSVNLKTLDWHEVAKDHIDEFIQTHVALRYMPGLSFSDEGLSGRLLDEEKFDVYQYTREELKEMGKEHLAYNPDDFEPCI